MHPKRFGGWLVAWLALAGLGAAAADVRLVQAVKRADKATVRSLLRQHVDVDAPEVDGTTALHWAAQSDDAETVDLLIRAGANVKATNRYGVRPLAVACTNGNAAIIEALLKAGADPNTASPDGETALMTAARTGKVDAVKVLLGHGATVNSKENWHGQTALMWAAAERHAQAVQALLERGADVHARSRGGLTPLLFAVRAGDIDSVRVLLAAGANVNDAAPDGTSALVMAIINTRFEVAAQLLDKGANPNAVDPRGSALHALLFVRNPGYPATPPRVPTGNVGGLELAKALLVHGANLNARIDWKEIRFDRDDGVVKAPPNIAIGRNFQSFIGATPFWLAARAADVPMMRLLAESGADTRLPTVQNVTPLMAAAGLGFWDGESPGANEGPALEAVKLSIELGNDVNAVADFGGPPIEAGGMNLRTAHPQGLGNAVGDMRWSGSTALHGAALRGANSIVKFLAEKGARLDVANKAGFTPLIVAEGVFVANTVKTWESTAALIRQLTGEPATGARQPQ
jgi:ankyrin repeat protein